MTQKITRQEEEIQTLQRFIENQREKFYKELVSYLKPEPCDVSYQGIDYQITYGDQILIGESRKRTSKGEIYVGIRNISANYPETLIYAPLREKKNKSSDKMTLLITCNSTGIYAPIVERGEILKRYFIENEEKLGGLWQHIFIVFPDGNIKLR